MRQFPEAERKLEIQPYLRLRMSVSTVPANEVTGLPQYLQQYLWGPYPTRISEIRKKVDEEQSRDRSAQYSSLLERPSFLSDNPIRSRILALRTMPTRKSDILYLGHHLQRGYDLRNGHFVDWSRRS